MRITLTVTERVNLGHYEFVEYSGTVDFDNSEADGDPAIFAQQQIDVLLRSHRRRAQQSVPDDTDDSFIFYHPALEK